MEATGTRFSVDYAKRLSSCKKCKEQLPKGNLRVAKLSPNPFSSEGGDMKAYFHVACVFETFDKARAETKVIESPADVDNWADLNDEDKADLLDRIRRLSDKRASKAKGSSGSGQKAAKRQKAPAGQTNIAAALGIPSKLKKTETPGKKETDDSSSANSANNSSVDSEESSQKEPNPDDSWEAFTRLCQRIAAVSKYTQKTAVVREFIEKGSSGDGYNGDLCLLCQMLLPGIDQKVYNLKEKQLIKLLSQFLRTNPDEMMNHFNSSGDVSETLRVYAGRSLKSARSTLTLHDVDAWLTRLARLTREDDQLAHFAAILRKCTPDDVMMIVRQIKKDLRINAGAKHILEALAPNAYEAFQASRDLREVVRKARRAPGLRAQLSVAVNLGTPVLPMLAEACRSVEYAMKKCPNGMFAEIKYDGERVQLHKRADTFHYYSRSLKPVQHHKVSELAGFIPEAFPGGGDLILDSEILLVDRETSKPLPFGSLGVHKKAAFRAANVCLFVFDCLLYQGKSLMHRCRSWRGLSRRRFRAGGT